MRSHHQYKTRLLEFLVKVRQHASTGNAINLSKLCNQIHIGAQLPTVLIEHGIIKEDDLKKDVWHWVNGQAVDGVLVQKVSDWSREYAKKKAARRAANAKIVESAPVSGGAWSAKLELEFIQLQLEDQNKMLKLIIERFGLK